MNFAVDLRLGCNLSELLHPKSEPAIHHALKGMTAKISGTQYDNIMKSILNALKADEQMSAQFMQTPLKGILPMLGMQVNSQFAFEVDGDAVKEGMKYVPEGHMGEG